MPFLSVVIPTYNGERFIAAALESILNQKHREEIELVVVDDGSTDQTLAIVNSFAESLRIRVINPGRIGNWVAATNLGLRAAIGEWACILHQDDLWLEGRLSRIWPEMGTATGALIVHDAQYVGPDGKELGPWTCPFDDGTISSTLFIERLLVQNFLAMPSPVFRKSAVIQSGGMDEALWFSTDWDLWLRLAGLGPVRFVDETLAAFRVHPASQTAARKVVANEWEQQLTTVLVRHLDVWPVRGKARAAVEGVAMASIAVNSALSAASRGERVKWFPVLLQLLALGPSGWRRYLRDSRIVQRVRSRLKVQRPARN
jgi:glycosyltransferase involved in cell wall biosynthesis